VDQRLVRKVMASVVCAWGIPAQALTYGLGQGVDSRSAIGVNLCVTGDPQVASSSFQEVRTDFAGDQSFNLKQLKGRLATGVDAKIFGASGNVDMLSSVQDTSKSITILMTENLLAKLIFLTNVKVIPGQERGQCGDHFVRARRLGGRMYIAYTFHFSDEQQRKHFSATASISLFFGLLKKTYTKSKVEDKDLNNIKVELRAWQFGGDPEALKRLIEPMQPNICTFADPDKCRANMQALNHYAQHDFMDQIDAAIRDQNWDALDGQGADLSDYGDLGIVSIPVDQGIIGRMVIKRDGILSQIQSIKAGLDADAIASSRASVYSEDLMALEQKLQNCSTYYQSAKCLE
jgi:hypothetical protein